MQRDTFPLIVSIFLSVSLAQGWIIAIKSPSDRIWLIFSILFGLTIISLIWAISKTNFKELKIKIVGIMVVLFVAFSPFMLERTAISKDLSESTSLNFWNNNYFYFCVGIISSILIIILGYLIGESIGSHRNEISILIYLAAIFNIMIALIYWTGGIL